MDRAIVISGDFSDPGSPLLAGPTEAKLRPTQSCVVVAANAKLAALKELGTKYGHALVIDHCFDSKRSRVVSRKSYRRVMRPHAPPIDAGEPT